MKLYLDTSTPTVILRLDQDEFQWQANREMAKGILQFISSKLQEKNLEWQDIEDITFYSGPGSFTGLRIGASVVNAMAHELTTIMAINMKSSFPTMVVPLTLRHLKNKHKHIKKYSKENGRVFFYLFMYKIKNIFRSK